MTEDIKFMEVALELARNAVEHGNEPFGAILVKDGNIVATSENKIITLSDPTHHAELGLVREYCIEHKTSDLSDYTLYTSCEPCFMCSGSLVWTQLGRVVCSARSRDLNAILGEPLVDSSDIVFSNSHHEPKVTKNILHQEGVEILKSYFKK